jgi:hypothetical protein
MQNLRASSNIGQFVYRPSSYGAFDAFQVMTDMPGSILTDDLKAKAQESIGRVLETPVFDFDADISIGNSRSIVIGDSENTSQMVQFTFATYTWGFTMTPALYQNNEIKLQDDFNTKFIKYLYKFADTLDSAALAALAANKTQIIKNPLLYNHDGGTINATWLQRENVLGDLGVIMNANDFKAPNLHVVGDAGIQSLVLKLAQKDVYNEVNKQNEYQNKVFHFTTNMAADSAKYGQGYIVYPGSIGMLYRFERECLLNTIMKDGHEWGKAILPMLNIPVGTYYYESVDNAATLAGAASADMDRVRKEHYGFAVDICFVNAYNTDITKYPAPVLGFSIGNTNASYSNPVVITNDANNPVITKVAS